MTEPGQQQETMQETEKKIEETRLRFKNEFVQDSSDKYDPRDVDRLEKDDALVEGYLQWRQMVVDDALKMIDESFHWRKEYGLNDLTESSIPKWMFETGAVFLHGYDKEGNKLFWFKVKLHVKDAKSIVDKKRYVAFWLERYARKEPGMPLTVVFDMAESGISNIDMDFVKYIISCFKVYYPKFLSKMVIVDMPWIMNAAWKIVKTWLGPDAISKLKFTSKNDVQMYIGPEYLPPHMGGTDQFKYSYPPLPDDDFQTPVCENGPIISEEDSEGKDAESPESLESSYSSEVAAKPRKVNFVEEVSLVSLKSDESVLMSLKSDESVLMSLKSDESVKSEDYAIPENRTKGARKPLTTFRGPLLNISPAEELSFGVKETDKRCLIILENVSKHQVAFKVRTTAPEKYRVKPSNTSCEPGASVDIVVSLHGGYQASPQDRFLVMAAEMEQSNGSPDLAQFWKDIPKTKVMEHRLRCFILESIKPISSCQAERPSVDVGTNGHPDLQTTLMRMMISQGRLEQRLDECLCVQKVLVGLAVILFMFNLFTIYLLGTS